MVRNVRNRPAARPERNAYGTELECCVLGIIRQKQPCTAYQVRRELEQSLSSFWSSSAGSVYPLLERITAREWLSVENEPWGEGGKKLYRLTDAGEQQVKRWVAALPEWAGAVTVDPIRTRVFFFEVLTPRQRLAFIDEARAMTKASLTRMRAEAEDLRRAGDRFGALASAGGIHELESRLTWLASLRRSLAAVK